MDSQSTTYLATVLPGLEGVLSSELSAKMPALRTLATPRGKVLFASPRLRDFSTIRTADNIYELVGRFQAGPHRADLPAVTQVVRHLAFPATGMRGHPGPTFVVNASRSGRHTYSRFEAAEAVALGIASRFPRWRHGSPEAHDLEFRLDISGHEAVLSLRLTAPSFRYRGSDRAFAQAALRPPVAHGLVWLSGPSGSDRFLDPFCGSGTILSERLAYPAISVRGGDISSEALTAAVRNLGGAERAVLAQWDARSLPLEADSVDRVVANLPFGIQVGAAAQIPALYGAFARELRRVLQRRGVAILLTDQMDCLLHAAERGGLACEPLLLLSLKGRHPRVFRLTR